MVIERDTLKLCKLWGVYSDHASEYEHADQAEDVVNHHFHCQKIKDWPSKLFRCLQDDPHGFDFIHKFDQLQGSDEHDELIDPCESEVKLGFLTVLNEIDQVIEV